MELNEIPSVYFNAAKGQPSARQKRALLEQGLKLMRDAVDSEIYCGNAVLMAESVVGVKNVR